MYNPLRVQIPSDRPCDPSNPWSMSPSRMASECSISCRGQESRSRSAHQDSPPGTGMVPRPTDLPILLDPGSRSPSRPLRNCGEPSTPIVCSPQNRPTSSGSGRTVHELEPMGENLNLPPKNLTMKVLDKMRRFRGTAAVVAPLRHKSSWFPLLLQMKPRLVPLPAPILSQIVQRRKVFASSLLTQRLHLIVFSNLQWGEFTT